MLERCPQQTPIRPLWRASRPAIAAFVIGPFLPWLSLSRLARFTFLWCADWPDPSMARQSTGDHFFVASGEFIMDSMTHPTDADPNFQIIRELWPALTSEARLIITGLVRDLARGETRQRGPRQHTRSKRNRRLEAKARMRAQSRFRLGRVCRS